jgi:hypothetical protein
VDAREVRDSRFPTDFEDNIDLVGDIDVGTSIELQEGVAKASRGIDDRLPTDLSAAELSTDHAHPS